MKLIDPKGRLFGVINVIDLLALIFILSFIPLFIFSLRLFMPRKVAKPRVEYVTIELYGLLKELPAEMAEAVAVADTEPAPDGSPLGTILWRGETRPHTWKIDLGNNKFQTVQDPFLKEIPVKLSLRVERIGEKATYNMHPISLNDELVFRAKKYTARLQLRPEGFPTEWVTVKICFTGLTPGLSKLIREGANEKDETNQIIGKVNRIISSIVLEPSPNKLLQAQFDQNIKEYNRVMTVVEMKLFCRKNNTGEFMYKDFAVRVGSQIVFATPQFIISGDILELE